MGRASRKKWWKRIFWPLEKCKHLDPKKLAHQAMLYRRTHPLHDGDSRHE